LKWKPWKFRERIPGNPGETMRLLNNAIVVALLTGLAAAAGHAQDKGTPFPSDSDINLAVLQADSAMDQYRAAAAREETVIGATGADAVARDKQLVGSWNFTVKGLQVTPQTFNGELGLEVVLMLDDASRNMALCSGAALANEAKSGPASGAEKGESAAGGRVELARSCNEASAHLHTVSQSVATLYRQYVEAEHQQAAKASEKTDLCGNK